jgi:hypothetical protein
MGIDSINEPGQRTSMLTPVSINEGPQFPVDAAPPAIEGIAPETCVIGDADFPLVITGTGFYPGSVINFAGHDEPTTFEDGTLSTGVKPSLWGSPATVQVQVHNGAVTSNAVDFTFDAPAADPAFAKASAGHAHEVDPDDLDEEIDEAAEEGDFKPMHKTKPKRKK